MRAPNNEQMVILSPLFAELMNYEFDRKDLVCLAASTVIGVWYLYKKVGH